MKQNFPKLNNFSPLISLPKNPDSVIFAVFTKVKNHDNLHQLIATTFFVENTSNLINIGRIQDNLNKLNMRNILFVIVSDKTVENESTFLNYDLVKISYEKFFTDKVMGFFFLNKHNINKNYSSVIFMFSNESWNKIVIKFRLFNIIVSGGSNNKRHQLSPIHVKLTLFLITIFGHDQNMATRSFYTENVNTLTLGKDLTSPTVNNTISELKKELFINKSEEFKTKYNNNDDIMKEESILNNKMNDLKTEENENIDNNNVNNPSLLKSNVSLGYIQKRSIHTSTIRLISKSKDTDNNNNNNNNNKNILSFISSLDTIINNPNISRIEAQQIIEDNWINIIQKQLEDVKYIVSRHSQSLSSKLIGAKVTLNLLYEQKEINKKFPLLNEDLNKKELLMIAYAVAITYYSMLKYTALSIKLGNEIIFYIYKNQPQNIIKDYSTFSEFKNKLNFTTEESLKLGDFFFSILSQYPHNIFERVYKMSTPILKEQAELHIRDEHLDEIRNNVIILPSNLPMLCLPNKWSDNDFGGYLNNSIQGRSVITGSHQHNHLIENKDVLYKAINKINSIKFKINNDLLNYLNNEGKYLINNQIEDKSELLQREITLKIAELYSKSSFYLNVHSDWRGRIYVRSFFISYQGNDLSKALINFEIGEPLNNIGKDYLYIYGANNHNENSISKASLLNRIEWVKTNYEKIINLDKSLILSAENKFVFVAFCLNMRLLHNNPNALISTPIFLDATCSGIQHLAALLRDIELGTEVNLRPTTEKDIPKDIYSKITEPVNLAINKFGEENEEYRNLALIKFTRSILKQSIMTKVYNVSTFGISRQLMEKLVISLKKDNKLQYVAPGINGIEVPLTKKEIFKISQILNDQIFILYPSLNWIYNYLIDVAKLTIKLNIPLSWITPAGLKITQHYLSSKKKDISITFAGKTKKMTFREKTNKLLVRKQSEGIIPNIVHSLDANHLMALINKASDNNFEPIITIHDCFGTLPAKMADLDLLVKKEFVLLYTQEQFLKIFHKRLIQSIKDNMFIIYNDKVLKTKFVLLEDDSMIEIPNLPKLGKLDIKRIIESKYMIT